MCIRDRCKPGQVKAHSKFKAEVYILKKEEGGRHTPFHNKYRTQFYIRTLDVTGEITLPEGTAMVMPGDNVTIDVGGSTVRIRYSPRVLLDERSLTYWHDIQVERNHQPAQATEVTDADGKPDDAVEPVRHRRLPRRHTP